MKEHRTFPITVTSERISQTKERGVELKEMSTAIARILDLLERNGAVDIIAVRNRWATGFTGLDELGCSVSEFSPVGHTTFHFNPVIGALIELIDDSEVREEMLDTIRELAEGQKMTLLRNSDNAS